jgi:molybdenum cofactor sulfurtransferase
VLPTRLFALHGWLHQSLEQIRHANGMPVIHILTHDPNESRCSEGVTNPAAKSKVGYVISCTFHRADGTEIPISQVSSKAAQSRPAISLRTGCVCNPGGAFALRGIREQLGPRIRAWMCGENEGEDCIVLTDKGEGATATLGQCNSMDTQDRVRMLDLQRDIGTEAGVVRLSLGIITDFRDVWEVLKFAMTFVEA